MLASAYEEMIRDAVKEKYVGGDYIYKTIYDAEDLDNQIVKLKNEYAVPLSFNESAAADAVENGLSSLSDFDAKQAKVVSFELDRRKQPSDPARYDSRYAYYRKQKVLQYVQYVESLYNIFYNKNYKTYDVDKTYFNLDDSNYVNLVQKIDGEVKLDETMFADVAQVLADMTLNVVSIRDKIKTMVERNSIRGTWLIVALYVIEYFRNVVKNNYKGAGDGLTIKDFSLVEYYDNTEYFNVENERINYTAEQRQQLNSRFWEETRTGTLETSEISVFYRDLIEHASKAHVSVDLLPVLPDFMKTLYRAGSNQRYDFASNSFYGLSSIVQARLD
jgi:hypothetical protein